MNKNLLRRWVSWSCALLLSAGCFSSEAISQRIALGKQMPVLPAGAVDTGALPQSANSVLTLYLQPLPEQTAALDQFLAAVQTPSDPQYRTWLTPAQFGERFGATAAQLSSVKTWAAANGLTVGAVTASGLAVSLTGTVAQVEAALAPGLHSVQAAGKLYTTNTAVPSLSAALPEALAVGGLSTLPTDHAMTLRLSTGAAVQGDALAALNATVNSNAERVLSLSGTSCVEDMDANTRAAMQMLLKQASAQGMTVLATSGCGARGSGAFPANTSEVTAVAPSPGITPPLNALLTEARPAWQAAFGLPTDSFRHEPDVTASDLNAFAQTMNSILASMPTGADGKPARVGNINAVLYGLIGVKGLYTQPDNAPVGTWEAATGLGEVDLKTLQDFFPRGIQKVDVSAEVSSYYATHGTPLTFTSTVKNVSGQGNAVPTGTVTFTANGTYVGQGTLVSNGDGNSAKATSAAFNQLAAAHYDVTATYSGDANYASATGSTQTTVAAEAVTLSVPATQAAPLGSTIPVVVNATLPSGVGNPTGQILITPQGTQNTGTYSGTLVPTGAGSSSATVPVPAVRAGSIALQVLCDNSDPNYTCYQSPSASVTVSMGNSTTYLTVTPNPPAVGQTAQMAVTVRGQGGQAPAPTGTVEFFDNGVSLGSRTLSNGSASFTTGVLATGAHSLTAHFYGDSNYYESDSTQAVTSGAVVTTTSLAVTPNSPVYGTTTTLTATVSFTGSTAVPGGTVDFFDGTTFLGSKTVSSGTAVLTSTTISGATAHSFTARYNGDNNFTQSTSTAVTTVGTGKGNTTITLSAPSTNLSTNQSVTITATVAASGSNNPAPLSGTVTFSINGTAASPASAVVNGKAMLVTTLPTGTASVTATYSGDTNWNSSSTTQALSFTVTSGTTAGITLTTSTDFAVAGTGVTLTATIAPSSGGAAVGGSVTFYDLYNTQTVTLGTVGVGSSGGGAGVAQFSTTGLQQGTHVLSALYSGDSNYASVRSATHTIYLTDYSLAFAPGSLSLTQGQTGSSTVTVTPLGGFGGQVTLACAVPSGSNMTCSFSPSVVTAPSWTSTLTVTTSAGRTAENRRPLFPNGKAGALSGMALAALGFGFCVPAWRRRRPALLVLLLSVGLLGALGCTNIRNGGTTQVPAGGTPLGTQYLTITSAGTQGGTTVTHTAQFSVTVQ